MASLIGWLANAGSKKADGTANAGGKIYFYAPDSGTTLVPVYQDEDKVAQHSSPVVLDGFGCASVWTDRIVRMDIFDADGNEIVSLDRANSDTAKQVEVENDRFTGTLSTGSQGAGGRTQLNAVLTLLGESAGGMDGKFLDSTGGAERTYVEVIGEMRLSVKDRKAKGDGSTDDTAAIREAIAVMKSRGGGTLYFPRGTYLVNNELPVDFSGLIVKGDGPISSVITSTVTNKGLIVASGGQVVRIEDIGLASASPSSEAGILLNDVNISFFQNVQISGFLFSVDVAAAFQVTFVACTFQESGVGAGLNLGGAVLTKGVRCFGCYFDCSAGAGTGAYVDEVSADTGFFGCRFSSNLTTGIDYAATLTGVGHAVVGCNFREVVTTAVFVRPAAAIGFREYANDFGPAAISDASKGAVWGSFSGGRQGTSIAAAATLVLIGGQKYIITGNTNVDFIQNTGYELGDEVTLFFTGTPTLNYNTAAPPAGSSPLLLAGAANFGATAGDNITLCRQATGWTEKSRTVI
jgi:hypothetical protein